MRIGASLALVALGAILRWAITADLEGVDLNLIGVILMVVGVIGLILSLIFIATRRRTDVIHRSVGPDGVPVERGTTYLSPTIPEEHI